MLPAERDAAILEHLRRYHLTTPEILHRLFFPGTNLNAVRKVTSRLIRERRISPARLFEQRKYFVLTPREAERLGEHRSIGRKFNYQGLVNAFGLLSFCVAAGVKKFTPREFAASFGELVIPGVRSGNYYLDAEETPEGRKIRIAFIHVDYGTSPETIRKKVRHIISRAYGWPAFLPYIRDGRFVVTVVTPTAEKAEEIKILLMEEPASSVFFRIEPVADLGELLVRRGRLKENRRGSHPSHGRETGKADSPTPNTPPAADLPPVAPAAEASA